MSQRTPLHTDIAWSTPEAIGVHGHDLCNDLLGEVNFGDMAFLEVTGRLPTPPQSRMFNAILVTLVEHGIVPSTLAARMTYAGAPEAMQAAVAAGLLGLGSVFVGSTEGSARMLAQAFAAPDDGPAAAAGADLPALAEAIVRTHRTQKKIIPGLGHPIHKPVDPRTVRLFAIAEQTGFHGRYVALMQAVAQAASAAFGKPMPINATGAIGALCCEMGLSSQVSHGLGVMARAVGLVGHVLEEARRPMAVELWHRAEDEATAHMRGRLHGQASPSREP
ncbi:citryl-CoA lyase [Rhodoferax koreense]|uniref:citrate synthase (unknown stereospecificity) n=1 Tax=Rhodoferax koreensis TaxID=1842727 RepID=A0A1P8JYE6_9BURK|nr:citryl-CoA lyase [Rhodoferax koreense]APW38777.1 citryl-CoA lyase [Rhodoferax koreense]